MLEFLFVFDEQRGEFPVRFAILGDRGEGVEPPLLAELTGTIQKGEVAQRSAGLVQAFPGPRYTVARAWGNGWAAIQNNYKGLRDYGC